MWFQWLFIMNKKTTNYFKLPNYNSRIDRSNNSVRRAAHVEAPSLFEKDNYKPFNKHK